MRSSLLLEEIIERRPRVVGTRAGRRRRSFLLACYSHLVRGAFISRVLFRDALFHRLHALEPATGIEIHALLARMQFKRALRTFSVRGHALQHSPALRAARNGARAGQIHRPRPERMIPLRRPALALRRRLPRQLSPRLAVAIVILISRLTVFRHRPSPSARQYSLAPPLLCASLGIDHNLSPRIFTDSNGFTLRQYPRSWFDPWESVKIRGERFWLTTQDSRLRTRINS
jgi:hypothetical protein